MADGDEQFREIGERLLAGDPDVATKRAFGSPGLRYKDRIFAMLVRDALVVKLGEQRCGALAADVGAAPFRIGNRSLREWVAIGPGREFEWDALTDEALAHARRAAATDAPEP
jgi:hypothetical protein